MYSVFRYGVLYQIVTIFHLLIHGNVNNSCYSDQTIISVSGLYVCKCVKTQGANVYNEHNLGIYYTHDTGKWVYTHVKYLLTWASCLSSDPVCLWFCQSPRVINGINTSWGLQPPTIVPLTTHHVGIPRQRAPLVFAHDDVIKWRQNALWSSVNALSGYDHK